jgi:hypothetical protein
MIARGAPLDPASPLPLWLGLTLALAAMLAALLVQATFDLSTFPAIVQACSLNLLSPEACAAGATRIGLLAVFAYSVVLAGGIALHRWSDRHGGTPAALPETAIRIVLIVALAVVVIHLVTLVAGPAFASRNDESLHYGALVSIENLLWPLLLQLYVSQPESRLRASVLATLLAVMALSPYRSASLAIMTFGFAVPLAATLWQAIRAGLPRVLVLAWLRQAAFAVAIGTIVAWGGYVGTVTRFPSLLVLDQAAAAEARARARPALQSSALMPAAAPKARVEAQERPGPAPGKPAEAQPIPPSESILPAGRVTAPPPAGVGARIAQRVVFPLYQAAIVGELATLVPLPSLANDIGRKFRLTEDPTLEEFLFRRIYGGTGADQTTSLFFGEAVAYFPGPPLVWMVLGPLMLVMAALLLRRGGIPSGTALGVALWRSSFSGLAPVLPALVIQLASLAAMGWAGRIAPRWPWLRSIVQATARYGLTVAIALVLVVQVWELAVSPSRRHLTIVSFTVAPQCELVSPTWIPPYADQVLTAAGMQVRSSLAWSTIDGFALTLPLADRMQPVLGDIARRLEQTVRCSTAPRSGSIAVEGARRFPASVNPLDVLSALSLAVALLGLVGGLPRRAARTVAT